MCEITILMPVRNTPVKWFKKAIESIANQSLQNFELLVLDDNSDLKLRNQYQDICQKNIHRFIFNSFLEHNSLACALNRGLKFVKTKYVARFDSDDIAKKDWLKSQLDIIKMSHAKIVGCQMDIWDENFETKLKTTNHPEIVDSKTAKTINSFWFVNHPGMMYETNYVKMLGGYPEVPNGLAEDYPLWISALRNGEVIVNNPKSLICYRSYTGSHSNKNAQKEVNLKWMQKHKDLL